MSEAGGEFALDDERGVVGQVADLWPGGFGVFGVELGGESKGGFDDVWVLGFEGGLNGFGVEGVESFEGPEGVDLSEGFGGIGCDLVEGGDDG